MLTDDVVFRRGDIVVTRTLARFGSVSFPINGIGSVVLEAPTWGRFIGLLVSGLLFILIGCAHQHETAVTVFAFIGLVSIVRAFLWRTKLVLRTTSGDQQAYQNRSRIAVEEVKAAIERAVTMRG